MQGNRLCNTACYWGRCGSRCDPKLESEQKHLNESLLPLLVKIQEAWMEMCSIADRDNAFVDPTQPKGQVGLLPRQGLINWANKAAQVLVKRSRNHLLMMRLILLWAYFYARFSFSVSFNLKREISNSCRSFMCRYSHTPSETILEEIPGIPVYLWLEV